MDDNESDRDMMAKEMEAVLGETPHEEAVEDALEMLYDMSKELGVPIRKIIDIMKHVRVAHDDKMTMGEKLGLDKGIKLIGGHIDVANGESILIITVKNHKDKSNPSKQVEVSGDVRPSNAIPIIKALKRTIKTIQERVEKEMKDD